MPFYRKYYISNLFFLLIPFCLLFGGENSPEKKEKPAPVVIHIPFLDEAPTIDGDLSDWRDVAFSDGAWDMERVRKTSWYQPRRNRLTNHGEKVSLLEDLTGRYYMAWDANFLYLGADVQDNINDVRETRHAPKRWYYKDAIAWFIEAPQDTVPEKFGGGDHGFCFVIDTTRPDYGAWWRHGTEKATYIETALPEAAVEYEIVMNPRGRGASNYILEAKIDMRQTFAKADSTWQPPKIGDQYGIMIVHCDPDGGEYGGHLLIYGKGDNDATWGTMIFDAAVEKIERREK